MRTHRTHKAPRVTYLLMLRGVKGILTEGQRLIVDLHACIRNVMATIVKCAEDIPDEELKVTWDSCFHRAIDHVFGLHAQCNAPAPQLSAICDDSINIPWCNARKVQSCMCESPCSAADSNAPEPSTCGANEDSLCAQCGAQRYLGKSPDIAREAVLTDGMQINVYSVVCGLSAKRFPNEVIREWVDAHTGNWSESINGANACSAWDKNHVCKGWRMRLQQTFGIMYASGGAELATLMRAGPIGLYLAFVQDTSFPNLTPAQLHAAAH